MPSPGFSDHGACPHAAQDLAGATTELVACAATVGTTGVATFLTALGFGLYADLPAGGLAGGVGVALAASALLQRLARHRGRVVPHSTPAHAPESRNRTILRIVVLSLVATVASAVGCLTIVLLPLGALEGGGATARSVAAAATLLQSAWLVIFAGRVLGQARAIRHEELRLGAKLLVRPVRAGQRGAAYYVAADRPA